MRLIRFKDNTYSWISDNQTSAILSEAESIAYGLWKLKVPKHEINLGIINLKAIANYKKDNVAIFSNITRLYLYTAKNGKELNTSLDENGGNIA